MQGGGGKEGEGDFSPGPATVLILLFIKRTCYSGEASFHPRV